MVRRGEGGWCTNCANPVTADSEWTRVSLVGGYADVVAVKVRPIIGTSNALYFIRSRGTDTTVRLNAASASRYQHRRVCDMEHRDDHREGRVAESFGIVEEWYRRHQRNR